MSPRNLENTSNFGGWGLTLVVHLKKSIDKKIKWFFYIHLSKLKIVDEEILFPFHNDNEENIEKRSLFMSKFKVVIEQLR